MKVYIAGKLEDKSCEYIKNIHNMCVEAERVRKNGFSVFIPGLDFLIGAITGNWDYKDYFDNSQPWLESSDALYVCPGWEKSKGTKKEIKRAKERNIPVFFSLKNLVKYKENMFVEKSIKQK